MLAGMFLFGLTTAAISEGGRSVRSAKGLILNSTFPRAVLPIVSLYKGLLAFGPSVGVVVAIYAATRVPLSGSVTLLPLLFVIQMVTNLGLALLVSTMVVFFRDAANLLNYVVRILFFTTPVIYPATLLGRARSVLQWQPLYPLFESYQRVFGGLTPRPTMVLLSMVWAGVFVAAGLKVFREHEHDFASRL
jgi:teichoic acid transport system permease protein